MAQQNPDEKELVSFRFRKSLKQKLASLAEATGRTQTFLAEEALEQYCELHQWQVEAIQRGIRSADAGELYTKEEALKKLMEWEMKRAAGMPVDPRSAD